MAAFGTTQLMRPTASWLTRLALACVTLAGCDNSEPAPGTDPVMAAIVQGWHVDTVGVVNVTEGDTLNIDRGLLAVEMTRIFPPQANGGEVFAWEFNAMALNPVKLLILRPVKDERSFEIIGESPLVMPRRKGVNRFELPEPIPLTYPSLFGFYMPEQGTLAFRKVKNWKTLITTQPLQRPFISRAPFSMYGWRYGIRAFWRKQKDGSQQR